MSESIKSKVEKKKSQCYPREVLILGWMWGYWGVFHVVKLQIWKVPHPYNMAHCLLSTLYAFSTDNNRFNQASLISAYNDNELTVNGTKSSKALHSDLGGRSELGGGLCRFKGVIQIGGSHSELGGHSDLGGIQNWWGVQIYGGCSERVGGGSFRFRGIVQI